MSSGLPHLPNELWLKVARCLANDPATLKNACLVSQELLATFGDVLSTADLRHVKTLSQITTSLLNLLEHIYRLAASTPGNQDQVTRRAFKFARAIKSVKIRRKWPYVKPSNKANLLPAQTNKYRALMRDSGLKPRGIAAWRRGLKQNRDGALMCLLVVLLTCLQVLEVQGDLRCLPTPDFLTKTRSLLSLRKVRLTAIKNSGLTKSVFHIIMSAGVFKLEFSDMYLDVATFRQMQPGDLASVTKLRFLSSYITIAAFRHIVCSCPKLQEVEYTFGDARWPILSTTPDARWFKRILRRHAPKLQRLIFVNTEANGALDPLTRCMGYMARFKRLKHVEANESHIMPPEDNRIGHVLTLPRSLKTLRLILCKPSRILDNLDVLLQSRMPPALNSVKIYLTGAFDRAQKSDSPS